MDITTKVPENMGGIEMRDFAAKPTGESTTAPKTNDKPPTPEHDPLRTFWSEHMRITIDEDDCRDHLALERTFLAYMRTASAFAQYGVTMAQLFRLNVTSKGTTLPTTLRVGKALGATTEAIAILVSLIGAVYFVKQQSGLMKGIVLSRGIEVLTMSAVSFVVSARSYSQFQNLIVLLTIALAVLRYPRTFSCSRQVVKCLFDESSVRHRQRSITRRYRFESSLLRPVTEG